MEHDPNLQESTSRLNSYGGLAAEILMEAAQLSAQNDKYMAASAVHFVFYLWLFYCISLFIYYLLLELDCELSNCRQ